MDDKIARLPKWAREHIAGLERSVREARQAAAEMCGAMPDAVVWADPYREFPRPLEVAGRPVRFTTDDPDETRAYIDVTLIEPGVIRVHGAVALSVEPEVTNSLRVRLVQR